MALKILLLLTLLAYSIIVSQSFMYLLALKNTQIKLPATTYIEIRKLIDINMRNNFTYVVYGALLSNLLLVIFTAKNPESLLFIAATLAFAALVADTALTLKGNMPINNAINTWSADSYPDNWADYRTKWLAIFQYRQVANIIGFVILLIGVVFGSK